MKNYYKILNIDRNANQDEIKKRYKKLVLEHHPDKGGDITKFREIQEAYETLTNNEKKQNYDNSFNQNYSIKKMNDTHYTLKVSLKEVYTGLNKTIKINTKYICENCKKECQQCDGIGHKTVQMRLGPFIHMQQMSCGSCKGQGIYIEKNGNCNCNQGYNTVEKTIVIEIEKGDYENRMYTINGLGEQPKRDCDIPGNIVIQVQKQDQDHLFKRNHLNLECTKKIKFTDAILGQNIIIEHYQKQITVNTNKVFGIIDPNKEYKIPKEGISRNNQKGDLVIKFEFIYPSKFQRVSDTSQEILKSIFDKIEW